MTTSLHSAIYVGTVRHRRFRPVPHAFRYRVWLFYLDLDELPRLFQGSWIWSTTHPAPLRFERRDYIDPDVPSLADAVRRRVSRETGLRLTGPVRMLTTVRSLGFAFNPVTFYYCFDESGRDVAAVVAEITNTPWYERHAYVLSREGSEVRARNWQRSFNKEFHVSPFLPMDMGYVWNMRMPGPTLTMHFVNHAATGSHDFDATMHLHRREATNATLRRCFARAPVPSLAVKSGIYWQAMRLWLKRVPFFEHPRGVPVAGKDRP